MSRFKPPRMQRFSTTSKAEQVRIANRHAQDVGSRYNSFCQILKVLAIREDNGVLRVPVSEFSLLTDGDAIRVDYTDDNRFLLLSYVPAPEDSVDKDPDPSPHADETLRQPTDQQDDGAAPEAATGKGDGDPVP